MHIETMSNHFNLQKSTADKLRTENAKLLTDLAAARGQLARLEADNRRLKDSVTRTKQESAHVQAENERLQADLVRVQAIADKKSARLKEVKHEADINRRDRNWLRGSLDELIREEERNARDGSERECTHARFQIGDIGFEFWVGSPVKAKSPAGSPAKSNKKRERGEEEGEEDVHLSPHVGSPEGMVGEAGTNSPHNTPISTLAKRRINFE